VITGTGTKPEDVTTAQPEVRQDEILLPADISAIPMSDSLLIMYAADVYGQIWRIRYDYSLPIWLRLHQFRFHQWTVSGSYGQSGSTLAGGDAAAFTPVPDPGYQALA